MDLRKHLENAAEAVKRRQYPVAIKLYSQLVSLAPDSEEARAGLRRALFKKVEQKPASKVMALLLGWPHLLIGGLCGLLRQHGAAAKSYERFLAMDPKAEGANLKLGRSLEMAGYDKAAMAVFAAYAEEEPRCEEASVRAGALLYQNGRMDDALQCYEQVLKVNPRNQEAVKARKNLAAEGALKKSGMETAQSSRELLKDKDEAKKLERTDRLQLSKEEIQEELSELETRLQDEPGNQKLLQRMADLLVMDHDLKGALSCLEDALAGDPGNSDLANKAGELRLKLQEQRVREAEERGDASAADFARKALAEARSTEYRRQVEQNPTDLRLRFQLGQALAQLERHDDAIAELQKAVKDPKVKGDALLLLGQAFAAKGMDELAMGQLEKALELLDARGEKGKEILYAMGCVAQNMGQDTAALAHFSRILEQDIGFKDVQKRIEDLKSAS